MHFIRKSDGEFSSRSISIFLLNFNCSYLFSPSLQTYLISILQTECEGIVRKEAVQVLSAIHENKKFTVADLTGIYRTMAQVAVNDLFWEVKVKALEFWHSVIKGQLTHQGVIDGDFPSVTFSKEKKKIVSLTEKEITSRLTRLLDELSASGCLSVLVACMRDEDDLLVVKASVRVINFLTQFLDKYTYWQQLQETSHYQQLTSDANARKARAATANNSIDRSAVDSKMEDDDDLADVETELARSDEIIQAIVSAQDIYLLSVAYENQMNMDTAADGDNRGECGAVELPPTITAYQFLREIKWIELDELVKSRTEWIVHTDSFSSLLNDMMYSLQVIPANEADCY